MWRGEAVKPEMTSRGASNGLAMALFLAFERAGRSVMCVMLGKMEAAARWRPRQGQRRRRLGRGWRHSFVAPALAAEGVREGRDDDGGDGGTWGRGGRRWWSRRQSMA